LTKCLRGKDEMALRTGFGPRAVVFRPLGYLQIFKAGYLSSSKHKHYHLKKSIAVVFN